MRRTEYRDTDYVSLTELAAYLDVSEKTVERMLEERTCPRPTTLTKQNQMWRWEVVRKWLEALDYLQLIGVELPTTGDKRRQPATTDDK